MDNLGTAELPAKEQVAGVLTTVLRRLDKFLRVNGFSVQDVIEANPVHQKSEPKICHGGSTEQALLKVALGLAGGHIGERVRLRDLRPKMEELGYARADVDNAIRALQLEDMLSVIPIDLPSDIDDRDRAAALDIAGVMRHAIIARRRTWQ